jgi:hypothetical protein
MIPLKRNKRFIKGTTKTDFFDLAIIESKPLVLTLLQYVT